MPTKEEFQSVLKKIDISKAKSIYGLSDGHLYINPNPSFIQKLASDSNLEIITIKGKVIEKIVEKVKESKTKSDATTGS